MEKWKVAIREAQTFSRMHVLLGMLDACIKWDMSAENARCKVCRKKGVCVCVCVCVIYVSVCLWISMFLRNKQSSS